MPRAAEEALVPARPQADLHLRREALTMALYVCITLIGALTITSDHGDGEVARLVWGTTVGLAAAHWVAFSLAARLLSSPAADERAVLRHLLAQVAAAALVAVCATVPLLLLEDAAEREGALWTTAGVLGLAVFGHARDAGAPVPRALTGAAVALALAFGAAALKHALA